VQYKEQPLKPKSPNIPNLTLTQQKITKSKRANLSKFPYLLKHKRNSEKIQVRQQKRLISFTRSVAEIHSCWSPSLSSSCLKNIPLSLNTHGTKRDATAFLNKKALFMFSTRLQLFFFFPQASRRSYSAQETKRACRRVKKSPITVGPTVRLDRNQVTTLHI